MATLFNLDQPARLAQLAVNIGADVPFFLNPVPSRVTGIGEVLTPLDRMAPLALVIAVPPIEVPTAAVFRELKPEHWSGPASNNDVRAIMEGATSPHLFVNDLAKVAMARWPEIAQVKAQLEEIGALAAAMTGSGAGVFGIFASPADAERAAAEMRRRYPAVMAVAAGIYAA
jgi:4-diphosphocytidyl-2-C-methyl-D-erythritol kinase